MEGLSERENKIVPEDIEKTIGGNRLLRQTKRDGI
jgi:hypothetical protein